MSAVLAAAPSAAQVVLLEEATSKKVVKVENLPDAWARAQKKASTESTNEWRPLLISDKPGFGAMFCVRDTARGVPARTFLVEGRATGKEAIEQARELARAYAAQWKTTPFLCAQWKNQNKHPLDTPVRVYAAGS
jgi:hypothetical protein